MRQELMIIAGPCAAETAEQVLTSAQQAQRRGIPILRACGWKPRTEDGWDGLKEHALPLLADVSALGLIPATEVLTLEDAELVVNAIDKVPGHGDLVLWGGSRLQSHLFQRGLAELSSQVPWLRVGFKNQMWDDERHFAGIGTHIVAGAGKGSERLFMCHRGFHNKHRQKGEYRNLPDYQMAMRVKNRTRELNEGIEVPMLVDPSHIGGSAENAIQVIRDAMTHNFDGVMLEVHPHPREARTDADQQLNWDQFDEHVAPLLEQWNRSRVNRGELVAI